MIKKSSILAVYEILKTYSDENHILTTEDIIKKLSTNYDIDLERKSIYRHIQTLIDFGYDISVFADNKKGYYLIDRAFEQSEVHLLIDAVHSSNFIPQKATKELSKKLAATQSKYFAEKVNRMLYVNYTTKTQNNQTFYNLDILDEAILNKRQISFYYCKYDINKNLVPRRKEAYIVNPYAMIWANENYYLVCNTVSHNSFSHYRIDKIKDIKIMESEADDPPEEFNPFEYAKKAINMFGGKEEKITLRCKMKILDAVIEKFGSDIILMQIDEDTFETAVNSTALDISFWALQYLNYCEVISPKSLRDEIFNSISLAYDKYKK